MKSRKILGMFTPATLALYDTYVKKAPVLRLTLFYSGVPVIQVAKEQEKSTENSAGQKRGREDESSANAANNGEERPAKKVDAKEG